MISVRCHLCDGGVPARSLMRHLRVMHPDRYEPVETWPDGSPVIVDDTRPEWLP